MSAPPPPTPSPLILSQTRQAEQLLLASFPLIALGVAGIAVATFLLTLGRVNRAHVNLWISLGCAFLAGLFELINVLRTDPGNPLRLFQLSRGLVVVDAIALGFFVTFHLFFLSRRCGQPGFYDPPTANFPLPVSHDQVTFVAPVAQQEESLVPPVVKRLVRPALFVAILATGFVESAWRIGIGRDIEAYKPVYKASNAMQLLLQLGFLSKVAVSAVRSRGRPHLYVFLSYLPFFLALLLRIIISITALASFAFTETPLGRLLIFIEMYIFLLETSLLDYKRPYRDSFSFERVSSRSRSTSSGEPPKEGEEPPASTASQPGEPMVDEPSASSTAQDGSASESTLASSTTAPVLRRSSNLFSWLPVVRPPSASHDAGITSTQDRLAAGPAQAVEAGAANHSLLVVKSTDQLEERAALPPPIPPFASKAAERATSGLSEYRFPESVGATSGGTSEVVVPVAEATTAPEDDAATPTSGEAPPTKAKRCDRPVSRIDTNLSAPATSSSSSRKHSRTSKPLPPAPPPDLNLSFPHPTGDTTSTTTTTTTLKSLLSPRFLPSSLPHPTLPLEVSSRPAFPPRASSDTLPYLARLNPEPASNPTETMITTEPLPIPIPSSSLTSTVRSSTTLDITLSTTNGGGGGGEGAIMANRFPYPPPDALIRTLSGRTGTSVSLGRVRTREGSEFDIVSPVAGEGREGVEKRRSCNEWSGAGADMVAGVDVTSLIVGGGGGQEEAEVEEVQERLTGSPSCEEGGSGSGKESPVAGAAFDRSATPTIPVPAPLYHRGSAALPLSSSSRPTRVPPPPRPWPPPPPSSASSASPPRTHLRNPSTASTSSSDAFYPPAPPAYPPPSAFEPSSRRRPSAVSLEAQQIRSASFLPLSFPSAAAGQPHPRSNEGKMKRFVFPPSSCPSGPPKAEGEGRSRGEKIVLHPAEPFERPRRVPEVRGERFSPKKGERQGGGELGERIQGKGRGEGEVHEVVGVVASRERGERVVSLCESARWSAQ